MQGGVLAACISVKVTVDFCCTVPFSINTATEHTTLSPSHTHAVCCGRRKYDSQY